MMPISSCSLRALVALLPVLAGAALAAGCGSGGASSSSGGTIVRGGGTTVGGLSPRAIAVGAALPDELFAWPAAQGARGDGDFARYSVTLAAGVTYRVSTGNAHAGSDDPYLYVASASGFVIAEDDNSGGGKEASIDFTPSTGGVYVVRLRAQVRGASGRCALSVADTSAPPGTALAVGQKLTAQPFEWRPAFFGREEGDYDQYTIALTAGHSFAFETSNASSATGGAPDTFLYMLDVSGTSVGSVVAEDDDGSGTFLARLLFSPPTTGTYALRLRAFESGHSGTCDLEVTDLGPVPPVTPRTALTVGAPLTGQPFAWQNAFADREDGAYDEYNIDLVAGSTYTITTANTGAYDDTYLYLLDQSLAVLSEDDDGNGNLHSKIVFSPAQDGTFVVRLRAFDQGSSGTCTLSVTSVTIGGVTLNPDLVPLTDRTKGYMFDVYYNNVSPPEVRFSVANENRGAGPMKLRLVQTPTGKTNAYQQIQTSTGAFMERLAGSFMFQGHATHNHYHFADFCTYNLREVTAGNGVGPIVASSTKLSFCLEDVDHTQPGLAGSPAASAFDCSNQGVSVGWSDVYGAVLEGQYIGVQGVPSGSYWLEHIADPSNRLVESDDTNNVARIRVDLNQTARTATAP